MADLIIKVVRATNPLATVDGTKKDTSSRSRSAKAVVGSTLSRINSAMKGPLQSAGRHRKNGMSVGSSDIELGGIKRTTETHVVFTERECDENISSRRGSQSSSIRELRCPLE